MSIFAYMIWNLCTLAFVVYCGQKLSSAKLLILGILWLFLINIRFGEWSACEYLYAFFDVPSIMLVCVCGYWIFSLCFQKSCSTLRHLNLPRILPIKFCSYFFSNPHFFNLSAQILWISFGAVFYLGFFGYALVDIYHLEFRIQLFVFALLALCAYFINKKVGFAMLVALVSYKLQILDQAYLFEYCIDPFLWLWCLGGVVLRVMCKFVEFCFGGKNG